MRRLVLLCALCAAVPVACIGYVEQALCAVDLDCGPAAFCASGACYRGTRACPLLEPSFSSINRNLFQVGCGVKQSNCHASDSAVVQSGPPFTGDLFHALVNAPAANRQGSVRGLVLVKPGDPAGSFLLLKLRLADALDPHYGGGQPASAPGTLCPQDLSVIEQWIFKGAPND